MPEKLIGQVSHYYDKIGVAVIKLTDGLAAGDMVRFAGKTGFEQAVGSMQLDHQPVERGEAGQEIALKVAQPVKPKDQVFIITA